MVSSKSLDPTPEQEEWDKRNQRIAWSFLVAIATLGILSFGSAVWIVTTSVTPALPMYLNDVEEIDRATQEVARKGMSRLILITTAFIFIFFKIRDALAIAYKNLGERPAR